MAEMGWVRRLAQALVKDRALADDVAQDTWLVAAQRRPDADRPLRPWLARVVINLIRTRRTSEERRERREAAAGDDRGVPTPDELVERVELQRAVADEVLALAEPYRSTVLLHFFEGYSSAEIARRLGIPDGTVRRRLKVAIDQLRDAFRKRSDPAKRGWLAALIPLARWPGPTSTPAAIGAVAMKKVITILVALLLLLLVGAGALWRHHTRRAGTASESTSASAGPQRASDPEAGSTQAAGIPAWIVQPGAPPRHIAGHVMFRGAPVAGAKVSLGLELLGEDVEAFKARAFAR